jgi:polysaccharide export outer membrane protein
LLVLAGAALPRPLPAQSADRDDPPATLHPGDALRITVWQHPEFSGEFAVGGDSTVRHPVLRELRVAGRPLGAVRTMVEQYFAREQTRAPVLVEPLFRVTIGGQVRQPNTYVLPPETTIAQAIGLAGGVTELGKANRVDLLRGGRRMALDLTRPDDRSQQLTILSGDQITVQRKGDALRVFGALASFTAAVAAVVTLARQ